MATVQVPIQLTVPDSSGNGYASVVTGAGTNIRELVPTFTKSVDGSWWGIVRVPQDFNTTAKIIMSIAANATTGTAVVKVGSKNIANAASYDAALTQETAQNQAMPGTAYQRTDVTFTLTNAPTAGDDLLVQLQRTGTSGSDTLAVDLLMFNAVFQYST